jgi:hypothetical protein
VLQELLLGWQGAEGLQLEERRHRRLSGFLMVAEKIMAEKLGHRLELD